MPAKPRSGDSHDKPRLAVSLADAHEFVSTRVALGRDLLAKQVASDEDLDDLSSSYRRWSLFNDEWLKVKVAQSVADEYTGRGRPLFAFGNGRPPTLGEKAERYRGYIKGEVNHLLSIDEQFELWVDGTQSAEDGDAVNPDGPIFIVHGRDMSRAGAVARMITNATDRKAVILAE